jgi:O-antigen/teichoic acid export membrane protein
MNLKAFKNFRQIPESYKRLIKNTFILFTLRGTQKILGLIVVFVLVRVLSQESFGEYNFVLTCMNFCALFALPGLNNAVMQAIARKHPGSYRVATPVSFFSSLIGSAILLGVGLWYRAHDSQEIGTAILLCAIIFPFAKGLTQWRAFKTGQEDFKGILKIESFTIGIRNFLVIVAVLLVPGAIVLPLAIFFSVTALQNIMQTFITLWSIPPESPAEEGILSYGFKLSLYKGLDTVASQLDRMLIFFLLSPASLAIFIAAQKVPILIKGLIIDIAVALGPRFAKHKHYKAHIDRNLRIFSVVIGTAIVTIAFTILPWVFTLIFGDSYNEAIPYTQALMCSYAISNHAQLKIRFIKSQMDSKSMRDIAVIIAVARIILSGTLIPLYGLTGAVISIFSTRVLRTIVIHSIMRKRYPVYVETS